MALLGPVSRLDFAMVMSEPPEESAEDAPGPVDFPPGIGEFEPDADDEATPVPFGPWASLGWSILCGIINIVVQVIVLIAVMVLAAIVPVVGMGLNTMELATSGLVLAAAVIVSGPVCVGYLAALVHFRGLPVREYLGWDIPSLRHLIVSTAVLGVFLFGEQALTSLAGGGVNEFMALVFRTAGFLPLLYVALVVMAPVFEETLFRGFLFKGLAESAPGPGGAIVITSFLWTLIHVQYGPFELMVIFVAGLFFGTVRQITGSVTLVMILHALMNLVATIYTQVSLQSAG